MIGLYHEHDTNIHISFVSNNYCYYATAVPYRQQQYNNSGGSAHLPTDETLCRISISARFFLYSYPKILLTTLGEKGASYICASPYLTKPVLLDQTQRFCLLLCEQSGVRIVWKIICPHGGAGGFHLVREIHSYEKSRIDILSPYIYTHTHWRMDCKTPHTCYNYY